MCPHESRKKWRFSLKNVFRGGRSGGEGVVVVWSKHYKVQFSKHVMLHDGGVVSGFGRIDGALQEGGGGGFSTLTNNEFFSKFNIFHCKHRQFLKYNPLTVAVELNTNMNFPHEN